MHKIKNGMQPNTLQYLADVVFACEEVVEIAADLRQESANSRRDALAIERPFEIIGEALSRIRENEPHISNRSPRDLRSSVCAMS